MTDQPEALRLADWLVKVAGPWPGSSFSKNQLRAAIFLQEQHEEIERLRAQIKLYQWLRNVCSKPSDAAMGDKP